MVKTLTRQVMALMFTLSSVAAAPAQAVDLNLNMGIVARQSDDARGVLNRVGYLRPGTQLRIPERFWQGYDHSSEATVMAWLKSSGDLRKFSTSKGIKADYYLPVEVVEPAESSGVEAGDEVYVSIRYLVRNDGLSLSVTTKTHAAAPNSGVSDAGPEATDMDPENMTEQYLASIRNYVGLAEAKAKRNMRNRKGASVGQSNFNSTCPIHFNNFRKVLEERASQQFIPTELLLSVMHLETVGDCFAYREEADGSASVGLFQINTRSSNIAACDQQQLREVQQATSIAKLESSSLRCLQNPIVNLDEAIRILREKYSAVNERKQPAAGRWYNIERQARDDWRKALSAYSGGQGYVFQAYYDMRDFSSAHGVRLDPNNWEHRRLFYFRQILDAKVDRRYFNKSLRHRRALENVLTNMAYVESIAGREAKPQQLRNTLIFRWIKELYFKA